MVIGIIIEKKYLQHSWSEDSMKSKILAYKNIT